MQRKTDMGLGNVLQNTYMMKERVYCTDKLRSMMALVSTNFKTYKQQNFMFYYK